MILISDSDCRNAAMTACYMYAHCIYPQQDRPFQKVGWGEFLVEN